MRQSAIQLLAVVLEIPLRVIEVRLPLLEEPFRFPQRETEQLPNLVTSQCAVAIAFQGDGLERATRDVAPCAFEPLRDFLR